MIVSFSVENWRSFKEEAKLNLTATRECQHNERIPTVPRHPLKLTPIAAIYGANASGKTKFIEALQFLQDFIIRGVNADQLIPLNPFKLDEETKGKPSRFKISVLINENIYHYSVILTSKKVLQETLEYENSSTVYTLFDRRDGKSLSNFSFNKEKLGKTTIEFLKLVAKGTRENILFLTNLFTQNLGNTVNILKPLYDWFAYSLVVITPASRFIQLQRFTNKDDEYYDELNNLLQVLDTGIDHLEGRRVNIEDMPLNDWQIQYIKKITSSSDRVHRDGDVIFQNVDGEVVAKKIYPIHKGINGDIAFRLEDESLGTMRLLDIIPMFMELRKFDESRVFVIDELDSSLHTKILGWLIAYYLDTCNAKIRNQLIFTTHDVNILTQELFRRDELWLIDRNAHGASSLYSISEFQDIRQDKDIRKLYLNGLIGGVPNIIG